MIRIFLVSVFVLASFMTSAQDSYSLTIEITNASSDDGQLVIGLYNSESSFLRDTYMGQLSPVVNGKATVTFNNVPKGNYAVSLFHDENKNNKLDSNFMGIPKEDYGCSNDARGFMGPPSWSDAKFTLNESKSIEIKL